VALRFSLTTTVAPYTPATIRGAWDVTTSAITGLLGYSPAGTASTRGQAVGSITAATDVLWGRWISGGALYAGTLSGTVSWIVGVVESIATANAFFHLHIYVTTGDSDTPRGTVLTDNIGVTEFTTTATGRGEGAQTLTSVGVQVGDRLVVEIGYQASADTTARTATMNYGNVGTADLTQGSTSVTTLPGYVEFSGADNLWAGPIGWLADSFDAAAIDTAKWSQNFGTVTATGGRARIQCDVAGSGLRSGQAWKLPNSAIYAQQPTVPAVGGGASIDWEVVINSGHSNGVYLSFHYDPSAGTLEFLNAVAFTEAGPPSVTFDAVAHKWVRYRCDGVNVYWETSPEGQIWTTRRTLAAPTWVLTRACRFDAVASRGSGTTDFGEIDFVNVPMAIPSAPSRHRVPAVPPRRARASSPVPAQAAAPAQPAIVLQFLRIPRRLLASRRRPVQSPPAGQAVPPPQPKPGRVRAVAPRRARAAGPVPAQAAPAPPPIVLGFARIPRRILALRRRPASPPPPSQAVPPPTLRVRPKPPRPARARAAVPPPTQTVPPPVSAPRRVSRPVVPRRPRLATVPPPQTQPPLITRIRVRISRLFRAQARAVPPPQVAPPPAPPAWPLQPGRAKKAIWLARRRRAGVDGWMVAGAHSCVTPRPSTGTTPYLTAMTTRPGTGTTTRPGSGTTVRPDTGITDEPC
jgi:hypothetical protein